MAYGQTKKYTFPQAVKSVNLIGTCKRYERTTYHLTGVLDTTPPLQTVHGVTIYNGRVPCPGAQQEAGRRSHHRSTS